MRIDVARRLRRRLATAEAQKNSPPLCLFGHGLRGGRWPGPHVERDGERCYRGRGLAIPDGHEQHGDERLWRCGRPPVATDCVMLPSITPAVAGWFDRRRRVFVGRMRAFEVDDLPKIERALVSVSDKTGPRRNSPRDWWRPASRSSPAAARGGIWKQAGIPVREVAAYTGFPEMMDGRIKTLHPKIHGGILCRRDRPDDMAAIAEQGIVPFELVVVNLYPFAADDCPRRRDDRRSDRADRHRRADAGPGGGEESCVRDDRVRAVAVSSDSRADSRKRARRRRSCGASWRARRSAHTATYDTAIAAYFANLRAKAQATAVAQRDVRRVSRSD